MPTILSNGTGGGSFHVGSTWVGGVVPSGTQTFQIRHPDVVTVDVGHDVILGKVGSGNVHIGEVGVAPATGTGTLDVHSSIVWDNATPSQDLVVHANGVIIIRAGAKLQIPNALDITAGDLTILENNSGAGGIQAGTSGTSEAAGNFGIEVIAADITADPTRTMNIRNPHYLNLTSNFNNGMFNYGPIGGSTYGPLGNFLNLKFDTLPTITTGSYSNTTLTPQFSTAKSITKQTIYSNFVSINNGGTYTALVSFGTTYSTLNQGGTTTGVFFPMAVPLKNGALLADDDTTPLTVQIWNVGQFDASWYAVINLPASMTTPASWKGLTIRTFADDGNGNWIIQDFVYTSGAGTVSQTAIPIRIDTHPGGGPAVPNGLAV
jgi:hypothetical protein